MIAVQARINEKQDNVLLKLIRRNVLVVQCDDDMLEPTGESTEFRNARHRNRRQAVMAMRPKQLNQPVNHAQPAPHQAVRPV